MYRKNSIFIAATGQNVGKTTLCLGIISGLKKRYPSVGFIKPVGQQHVKIDDTTKVDKDVVLFKEHFHLTASWSDMSPVIIPAGFTRDFLDERITESALQTKIQASFLNIYNQNAYTIVEGTGHVGVGAIVNMNNARVAADLGLDMVIIASGGLGSAFDELALNVALAEQYKVKIRGIILNRVLENKREMILEYFPKSLKRWGIPLIGCVPFNEFLNTPTIKDFEGLFNTTLIAGEKYRYRHFQHTRLVAGSLGSYRSEIIPNELVISPASREDIIIATLDNHDQMLKKQHIDFQSGMILTGRHPPSEEILSYIRRFDVPVLYAPLCSYDAMKIITSFTAKIRIEDTLKVEKAVKLVEENVNFDLLTSV